jgi:hypothetical protein
MLSGHHGLHPYHGLILIHIHPLTPGQAVAAQITVFFLKHNRFPPKCHFPVFAAAAPKSPLNPFTGKVPNKYYSYPQGCFFAMNFPGHGFAEIY